MGGLHGRFQLIFSLFPAGMRFALGSARQVKRHETPIGEVVRGLKKKAGTEKSLARIVWGWLFLIFMMILVSFIVVHFVNHNTKVVGNAMFPTLSDGDRIILDTVSYRLLSPSRYDIVIFPSKYEENVFYIRRVIALPGETVQISDGKVLINGVPLREKYAFDDMESGGLASAVITLAEDEYFTLGDNRNESSDSREPIIGNIQGEDIIGRAIARVWPLNRIRLLL